MRTYERQEEHGFHDIDFQHFYRSIDAIQPFYLDLQKQAYETVSKFSPVPLDYFFFDVTTLYFESIEQDDIKEFGFSKEQKHHPIQIVLALVVDSQGIPIAYEAFKGNLAETKTLIPVLELLKAKFTIKTMTLVCDRGMACKANIDLIQNFLAEQYERDTAKKCLQLNYIVE